MLAWRLARALSFHSYRRSRECNSKAVSSLSESVASWPHLFMSYMMQTVDMTGFHDMLHMLQTPKSSYFQRYYFYT